MQRKRLLYIALLALLQLLPSAARADCSSPVGSTGKVIYNGDTNAPQFCNGSDWIALGRVNPAAGGDGCEDPVGVEGQIIYNGDIHIPQYCDGDNWRAMIGYVDAPTSGGCTAPASCTSVGDVCSDGSIFAGFMVYNNTSCEPLYVTDNNQSASSQWKTASGTNDITDPDDHVNGQYNRDNRGGGTFPAFALCESNTYHGKSDWYLPALTELNLLWLNRAAIDANAASNFTTSNYRSSTEINTNDACYQYFGTGQQYNGSKLSYYGVRCVRRD